jgi:hypothetical protein
VSPYSKKQTLCNKNEKQTKIKTKINKTNKKQTENKHIKQSFHISISYDYMQFKRRTRKSTIPNICNYFLFTAA